MSSDKKTGPAAPLDDFAKEVLALENLLRERAPKLEFWQAIEFESVRASDIDDEIGWAEYGKFRLLYRRTKFDRNDEQESEKTMLMTDAPGALREELRVLLPLFMEAFAEHLESGDAKEHDPGLEEDDEKDPDEEEEE